MNVTRRSFVVTGLAGLAGFSLGETFSQAALAAKYLISARSFGDNLEAAKRAGLDGVEVGVGGPAERLRLADPEVRQRIKDQMKTTGLKVSSLSMDLLNGNPVATEPRAVAWLTQTIDAAQDLGAKGILVPFFGQADLKRGKDLKPEAVEAVVAKLKQVAPQAQAAKIYLGMETTCSAKQDLEILDRIGSDWVACYYDIGNSTNNGYDVPAEIREIKGRICLVHFKDGSSYLGEGKIKMEPVAEALKAINYEGWIVLETSNPSKNAEADCKRNGDYCRKLMGMSA
jgi:L-ribulose-5-phosphate 3-epimerase